MSGYPKGKKRILQAKKPADPNLLGSRGRKRIRECRMRIIEMAGAWR
jgi:hypothetical protein